MRAQVKSVRCILSVNSNADKKCVKLTETIERCQSKTFPFDSFDVQLRTINMAVVIAPIATRNAMEQNR